MLDFADELARPIANVVLAIARGLWWLVWEFFVESVGWYIGWPICRVLSVGRFPETGLHDQDQASGWEVVGVQLTGLAALGGVIWLLAGFVYG